MVTARDLAMQAAHGLDLLGNGLGNPLSPSSYGKRLKIHRSVSSVVHDPSFHFRVFNLAGLNRDRLDTLGYM